MCVAVVAAATAMLPVLSALSTGASVGDAWTSASGALPATDGAGDGPATDDQSALVGQTACPTDNDCFAVGGYLDSAGNTAGDIESISQSAPGASTVTHIVAPEPATDPAGNGPQDSGSAHLFAQLYSVSCASPSSCVAVGTYQDSAGEDWALVESWQGASTWTASVAPEPAGNSAGFGPGTGAREVATLWDVDCYAVGSCVAVGSYGDADGRVWPMIDTLSGGVWTATTVEVAGQGPGQDGVSSWLQAVSCTVDGFCVAGGAWNDAQESASVGIVATGSDGAWTSASPAPPTGVTALAQVTAVACAPSGPCVGLGPGNLGPGTGYGSSLIAYTYSQATQEWSTSVVPLPAGNAAGTPGSWFNDYDSIEVGDGPFRSGMSPAAEQSQLSLWALGSAPLILGVKRPSRLPSPEPVDRHRLDRSIRRGDHLPGGARRCRAPADYADRGGRLSRNPSGGVLTGRPCPDLAAPLVEITMEYAEAPERP